MINNQKKSVLGILKDVAELVKVSPKAISLSIVVTFFASTTQIGSIIVTQYLFNSVENHIFDLSVLSVFLGVKLICVLLSSLPQVIDAPIENRMFAAVASKLNRSVSNLDPLFFECTQNLDAIEKASKATASLPQIVILLKWIIFYYIPYFAVMSVYLWTLRPALALCVLFILMPMIVSQLLTYTFTARFVDQSTRFSRIMQYYQDELTSPLRVKETQVLGIHDYVFNKYIQSISKYCKKVFDYEKKSVVVQIVSLVLYLCGYSLSILLLYSSLQKGYISVGAFATVFSSLGEILLFTHMFVKVYIKNLMKNIAISENVHFFDQKCEYISSANGSTCSTAIELSHVSFTYPDSEVEVLHDISFTIEQGKTIVIVGENGAGKTTLANIILGLYSPSRGQVKYGDVNIYSYPISARMMDKSGVLQNFGKYKFTLLDNVSLCDPSREVKLSLVSKAVQQAGLSEIMFEEFQNTMLSKEYGGIDFSGGQWQHVALARGAYKKANLLVLDEPTSAIDPLAEGEIYGQYLNWSTNKTTLIVSHRLGCISFADKVLFLDCGKVEGYDSHENLMKTNKKYFHFYMKQAHWYIKK